MTAHFDPSRPSVVIDSVEITDPAVLAEARRWATGRRGPAVSAEVLVGSDLTAFVDQAVVVGAHAIATAGGTQEAVKLEALITEVGERTTEASVQAAALTEEAVRNAAAAMAESTAAARKALGEIADEARRRTAGDLGAATTAMTGEITRLLGGEQPELLARLQPVLDRFSRDLESQAAQQTGELFTKAARQLDPADPTSPMAQQARLLTEQHQRLSDTITRDGAELRRTVDELAATIRTAQAASEARAEIVKITPLKGEPYARSVHRVLAEIATGLGDEYVDSSGVAGRIPGSKKGDGVLTVQGGDARIVVEMTDSRRTGWSSYLDVAERNRDAHASLGVVRSADMLGGHQLVTFGPRRLVVAFDPETDSPDLLRTVVQLVRLGAVAGARGPAGGDARTADERIAEAIEVLGRIEKISRAVGLVRQHAATIDSESDSLRGELTKLLTQARLALGAGADDAAA